MTELDLPVYPELEKVLGYTGDAAFVAFYWTPYGDELVYDDGTFSGTATPWGFLLWVRHWTALEALHGYELGSSEDEASHWLILGRRARRLYVAPVEEAQAFLREQTSPLRDALADLPPEEAQRLVAEAFEKAAVQFQSEPRPNLAGLKASLEAESHVLERFRRWLDGELEGDSG